MTATNNTIIISNENELSNLFSQEDFIYIKESGKTMLLNTSDKILWWIFNENLEERWIIKNEIEKYNLENNTDWCFPTDIEMKYFAQNKKNPFIQRDADGYMKMFNRYSWFLENYNRYSLINHCADGNKIENNDIEASIVISKVFANLDNNQILETLRNWQSVNCYLQTINAKAIKIVDENSVIIRNDDMDNHYNVLNRFKTYIDIDYNICRLPKLTLTQLTDFNQGLWELYGKSEEELQELGIKAKNPAEDVKDWNVCIDFGTNSTVVAYEENGKSKLLRIGAKDFNQEIEAEDFENPTVLEFINFKKFIDEWNKTAYRPNVNWDYVKTSHEARKNLELKENDSKIIGSILTKIKQWAFQQDIIKDGAYNENVKTKHNVLKITDQQNNFEYIIPPSITKNPEPGELLSVKENDILDPIELYAWFLGITINWRRIGIFLRYYMTFPLKYPREVKDSILASFRRGLQRSLPESLVKQKDLFQKFSVTELASEPSAYAVAAMEQLNLIPDENNSIAYAVFDFGGGTTDFNFGYYRLPTEAEAETGCEIVFEHIGDEGDPYLGGENLVENLAYITFKNNKEVIAENHITFTKPIDAKTIPGCELLIDNSQTSKTNTLLLMSRLRPLWETGNLIDNAGVEKCKLLNYNGEKVSDIELTIPIKELQTYLQNKVFNGIKSFFTALHTAFHNYKNNENSKNNENNQNKKNMPEQIHILLAGNASRSELVKNLFNFQNIPANETKSEKNILSELSVKMKEFISNLFNDNLPKFIIHNPLEINKNDIYAPTAKTGVALGLLKLCPGSPIDVKYFNQGNSINEQQLEQAGFIHYVGAIRLKNFDYKLQPNCKYNEWKELGIPRRNVFNLYHTKLPQAQVKELKEGDEGLLKKRLELKELNANDRLFARAVAPNKIEICTAAKDNAPDANVEIHKLNNYQQIILK